MNRSRPVTGPWPERTSTLLVALALAAAFVPLGGCSPGNTCTVRSGEGADAGGPSSAPCAPQGASSGSSSGVSSSSGGSHGGSTSGSSSGFGSSGGSGSGSGGSSSSGSSSGSGGSGGEDCQGGQGDFCMCFAPSSNYPPNSTSCSPADLQDEGECCADPGWPGTGDCICSAFLCYVNQGGGRDCYLTDLGGNGAEVPTTSATGAVCCLAGSDSLGWICSCYDSDNAGECSGRQTVSECTMNVMPSCSSAVTTGYTHVATCR